MNQYMGVRVKSTPGDDEADEVLRSTDDSGRLTDSSQRRTTAALGKSAVLPLSSPLRLGWIGTTEPPGFSPIGNSRDRDFLYSF